MYPLCPTVIRLQGILIPNDHLKVLSPGVGDIQALLVDKKTQLAFAVAPDSEGDHHILLTTLPSIQCEVAIDLYVKGVDLSTVCAGHCPCDVGAVHSLLYRQPGQVLHYWIC